MSAENDELNFNEINVINQDYSFSHFSNAYWC